MVLTKGGACAAPQSDNHDMRYITFEPYYAPGVLFHYCGNILLDSCSPIVRCDRA